MKQLSILIADDHPVVRRGIRTLLEVRSDWTICGEAATGSEAIEMTRTFHPDLVLLDLAMPGMGGLEAIPQILGISPGPKILVLTVNDSGEKAAQVLAAGASGLVLKSDAASDMVQAIEAIEKDQLFLSPAVARIILGQLTKTSVPVPSCDDITPRELEVLKLLALGRGNKEVAVSLGISVKTVDVHRANIMHKLNLSTYSDLIQFAIRHKIIEI